jgi:hypothetical protein
MLLAAPAFAATGPQSYTTVPPGTVMGNPQPWADNPIPHAQSFATVGHIAILKGALMQVTTDQPMSMLSPPAKYQVTAIYATNCTVSPSGDLGGIYTAASKGGTAVVAASQAYTALASVTAIQELTINITASLPASQLYFSLSTGTTGGPCDLYVDGIGLQ